MIFKVVPIRSSAARLADTHRAEQWAVASFRRGFPMRILVALRHQGKGRRAAGRLPTGVRGCRCSGLVEDAGTSAVGALVRLDITTEDEDETNRNVRARLDRAPSPAVGLNCATLRRVTFRRRHISFCVRTKNQPRRMTMTDTTKSNSETAFQKAFEAENEGNAQRAKSG